MFKQSHTTNLKILTKQTDQTNILMLFIELRAQTAALSLFTCWSCSCARQTDLEKITQPWTTQTALLQHLREKILNVVHKWKILETLKHNKLPVQPTKACSIPVDGGAAFCPRVAKRVKSHQTSLQGLKSDYYANYFLANPVGALTPVRFPRETHPVTTTGVW